MTLTQDDDADITYRLQFLLIAWGGGHLNTSVVHMGDKRNAKKGC